jgi:Sjoegren syndrome nuclear autoantigen 1
MNSQIAARTEYDRVIQEIESAYDKILQSSQTLLTIARKECSSLHGKQPVAQPAAA